MSEAACEESSETGAKSSHSPRTNAGALARQKTQHMGMNFRASDSDGNGRLEFDEVHTQSLCNLE